ncbi:hypothetical protein [Rheinheimera aquimaris]|uniref:hypothetical protein n=1 Tax=Rheinheimera aquimaris TaxID=412437 RepID=UPI0039E2BA74
MKLLKLLLLYKGILKVVSSIGNEKTGMHNNKMLDGNNMYPYTPELSNPETLKFIETLLAQPIRPPKGVAIQSYAYHHQPLVVKTINTDYPNDECWYNCVDYSVSYGHKPVFGWAIWQAGPDTLVAQHHAVVDTGDCLLDVTLGPNFSSILFVPDENAPFDFNELRFPFNFELSREEKLWFAFEHTTDKFSIAKCVESERAKLIIKAGLDAGVI